MSDDDLGVVLVGCRDGASREVCDEQYGYFSEVIAHAGDVDQILEGSKLSGTYGDGEDRVLAVVEYGVDGQALRDGVAGGD
ncbi:hypothetical protein [Streptomyces griseorubiginosus]|uniref:Uncharacterized protein n=1 Tax=Streptomyces griseorubiginosus TaxID=67304 RepID=A0A101RPU0_9ACTN|nr:hypothetical protein [Streptomyces griseorubiginosus]KUN59567.1 hypothetical protein AQJ54_39770 [Streptomyces griseorubiginosus]